MRIAANPLRGVGLPADVEMARGTLRTDAAPVRALLAACPVHAATPLLDCAEVAATIGIASLRVKDERQRMGLGSFKALGGAYAVACAVKERAEAALDRDVDPAELVSDEVKAIASSLHVICASAGNHGLSIAAGARVFGARASVYLSASVPEGFADRLRALGAEVVRAGDIYEESLTAAEKAAAESGALLIADSTWPGYVDPALLVMEGYSVLAVEATEAMDVPTHIFLQAGVGGLASALAATFRRIWGDAPRIAVVEPEAATCLLDSVTAGRPVLAEGPVSNMGRLDCKDPSHIALDCLAREADDFVALDEEEAERAVAAMVGAGLESSPSGAAGLVALWIADAEQRDAMGIDAESRVLVILSEGAI